MNDDFWGGFLIGYFVCMVLAFVILIITGG